MRPAWRPQVTCIVDGVTCLLSLSTLQRTEEDSRLAVQVAEQKERLEANLKLEQQQVAKLLDRVKELATVDDRLKQVRQVAWRMLISAFLSRECNNVASLLPCNLSSFAM